LQLQAKKGREREEVNNIQTRVSEGGRKGGKKGETST
jgi:hypothetical protein